MTTCEPLQQPDSPQMELPGLTLSVGVSPVSRGLMPGSNLAKTILDTSGRQCCALSTKSGQLGLLVKMLLVSPAWHSTIAVLTWRPQATMHNRLLFRLVPQTPRTGVIDAGLWPTPTVCGNYNRKGASANSGDGLATAVSRRLLPTPRASCGDMGTMMMSRRSGTERKAGHPEAQYDPANAGPLNPRWVEWLMGYPVGWTNLEGSETP